MKPNEIVTTLVITVGGGLLAFWAWESLKSGQSAQSAGVNLAATLGKYVPNVTSTTPRATTAQSAVINTMEAPLKTGLTIAQYTPGLGVIAGPVQASLGLFDYIRSLIGGN